MGKGSAFFTATFWSAIPCAEEEDEVGAEVVEEENSRRNKDVPTNKTAVPLEGTPKAPGQSGPPLISFLLTLACSPQKPT